MLSKSVLDKLQKIENFYNKYEGSIYKHAKKIKESDYIHFKEWVRKKCPLILDSDLEDYLDFAKIADGMNFNGLFMYSIDVEHQYNIYNYNETWWEDPEGDDEEYFFFGHENISWLCLNMEDKQFYILDLPSGYIMEHFSTFSEMMDSILNVIHFDELDGDGD